MKSIKYLPLLLLAMLGQVNPSAEAEPVTIVCTFLSPLRYSGTQWKVKSEIGPIYLARWENNNWRLLAAFDGTGGNYFLDWEAPTPGIYAAVDSLGRSSDCLTIGAN
jgi:hypothetical protein